MTKIIISNDCGNSPKNILPQELTIAFASGDAIFILSSVSDDIQWNIIGQSLIRGKSDLTTALETLHNDPVVELKIEHVVTHGRAGAVDGAKRFSSGMNLAFCDVFEFTGAKGSRVEAITSYIIQLH